MSIKQLFQGLRDHKGLPERRGTRVTKGDPERQGHKDHKENKERKDQRETEAFPVYQEPKEKKVIVSH